MTWNVHDDLLHFALYRVKSPVTAGELKESQRNRFTRIDGSVVIQAIACHRVAVDVNGDRWPCELVVVRDEQTCGSRKNVRFNRVFVGLTTVKYSNENNDANYRGNHANGVGRSSEPKIPVLTDAPHDGQFAALVLT